MLVMGTISYLHLPIDFGKTRGAMMGGWGSGRLSGFGRKKVAEDVRSIDVRRWQRDGLLEAGHSFNWVWWAVGGEETARIGVSVGNGYVGLSYRCRTVGGLCREASEWESVDEVVSIDRTPCFFGGTRPWFLCPGVVNGVPCGRRVAVLYGAGKYFLCRHCYDLCYQSQMNDEVQRLQHKAQCIRRRLGGDASLLSPFPARPKCMHRETYRRLAEEGFEAEMSYHLAFMQRLAVLTRRLGDRADGSR